MLIFPVRLILSEVLAATVNADICHIFFLTATKQGEGATKGASDSAYEAMPQWKRPGKWRQKGRKAAGAFGTLEGLRGS